MRRCQQTSITHSPVIRNSAEVEEICEDLNASGKLFSNHAKIAGGLHEIVAYLNTGGAEYVLSHEAVGTGYKEGKTLTQTIAENNMAWVRDFMAGGGTYKTNYEANLAIAKPAMRSKIYDA